MTAIHEGKDGSVISLDEHPERAQIEAAVQKARDMGDFVGPHNLYRWNGEIIAIGTQKYYRLLRLAKMLHESGRRAVAANKVVNKLGMPFLSWEAIDADAREGRLMMAYDLATFIPSLMLSPELTVVHPEVG